MSGAAAQTTVQRQASACGLCTAGAEASKPTQATTTQKPWIAFDVKSRMRVLQRARRLMAEHAMKFANEIAPTLVRTKADTLVTEVLPLLDACRFLERNAAKILAPRKLGFSGRPLWLQGVEAEVWREPLGHILVIGPANFPLFLAGAQVLQALAAGNRVTWKPGAGGRAVAERFAHTLYEAGLPAGTLTVTDDTVAAAKTALAALPDKVVFTGSQASGSAVLNELAKSATPAVMELSGADAIIVMPSADPVLVVEAVAFGLCLNGGAVCMSPRRLFASAAMLDRLRPRLLEALIAVKPTKLDDSTASRLRAMIEEAQRAGANVHGAVAPEAQQPLVIDGSSEMTIAQSDLFAPVITLIETPSLLHLQDAYDRCPYALTAAIFCGAEDIAKARMLAKLLRAGTVLINDVIAPTADARVPFGGRGASGYGVTRGTEGLLEMTAVKTLLVRKRGSRRHYAATTNADVPMFMGLIRASHGRNWSERIAGILQLISSGKRR
jgi:acyl-CoA reductase-like NAD-dependent aldehyde dehydrogenase